MMFPWIAENLATILISAAILTVIILIVMKLRRDKKSGAAGCSCGCQGCSSSGVCRKE